MFTAARKRGLYLSWRSELQSGPRVEIRELDGSNAVATFLTRTSGGDPGATGNANRRDSA